MQNVPYVTFRTVKYTGAGLTNLLLEFFATDAADLPGKNSLTNPNVASSFDIIYKCFIKKVLWHNPQVVVSVLLRTLLVFIDLSGTNFAVFWKLSWAYFSSVFLLELLFVF